MIRYSILLVVVLSGNLLSFSDMYAQTAEEIMLLAYEKSKTLENGFYSMTRRMKYMTNNDTVTRKLQCHFIRLPEDDLFGFKFYQPFFDSTNTLSGQRFFTGNELVWTSFIDSTGEITSKDKWSKRIEDIKHNYDFFDPFTSPDNSTIPHKIKAEDYTSVKLMNQEMVSNQLCHHIELNMTPGDDPKDPIKLLSGKKEFWIGVVDSLVLQYSTQYEMLMNNDTMIQYELLTIDSFRVNHLSDSDIPDLTAIPAFVNLKEYTPYEREELLGKNTIAPNWSLKSLEGNEVRLDDHKGDMVLIDFFYKSCFPCMQALPALQSLHEKFASRGLHVIGIDPYDKDADDLKKFLSKRGVTYTILLSEKDLPKEYKVSGYPTMYLIGKNGEVLYSQSGYGEGTEDKLEKIIEKNVKK